MIKNADIICDLAWGDCGKGKVSSYLSKNKKYEVKNSANFGCSDNTNSGSCCLISLDIFFLCVFFIPDITYHLITAGSSISCSCL